MTTTDAWIEHKTLLAAHRQEAKEVEKYKLFFCHCFANRLNLLSSQLHRKSVT